MEGVIKKGVHRAPFEKYIIVEMSNVCLYKVIYKRA